MSIGLYLLKTATICLNLNSYTCFVKEATDPTSLCALRKNALHYNLILRGAFRYMLEACCFYLLLMIRCLHLCTSRNGAFLVTLLWVGRIISRYLLSTGRPYQSVALS